MEVNVEEIKGNSTVGQVAGFSGYAGTLSSDEMRRVMAIELAISKDQGAPLEVLIKIAKAFEAYMKGDAVNPVARTVPQSLGEDLKQYAQESGE